MLAHGLREATCKGSTPPRPEETIVAAHVIFLAREYPNCTYSCSAPSRDIASRKKSELDMSAGENAISNEFAQEEWKTKVHYIEQHIHWAKSDDNEGLARLHMVIAESLIESANLVRTLCESLSEK